MRESKPIDPATLCISGLYYRYKKTSDEKIREHLKNIRIVRKEHKGPNTIYGYYPFNVNSILKMTEGPRINSFFGDFETENTPLEGLTEWKRVPYLVKSSSRFFLKNDIGEVFDQINHHDLRGDKIKAICIEEGHHLLDETDGEHFLMAVTLLS